MPIIRPPIKPAVANACLINPTRLPLYKETASINNMTISARMALNSKHRNKINYFCR